MLPDFAHLKFVMDQIRNDCHEDVIFVRAALTDEIVDKNSGV